MNLASGESWFYRPRWSAISVIGPDAASFLHNLCTNDIKGLAEGQACEALFTDVKAHVLAHAVVFGGGENYHVVVTSSHAADLMSHLDRYHIREKLVLMIIEQPRVTVAGNRQAAEKDLSEVTWRSLPSLAEEAAISVNVEESWLGGLRDGDWRELTDLQFDGLRIDRRFPLDQLDVDHRNLPQELNRDADLINFNKGCYLGQETVARIDALGRVNQLLMRVRTQTLLSDDDRGLLADGKVVGRLTSGVEETDRVKANALAYVRRIHATPVAKLSTKSGEEVTVLG